MIPDANSAKKQCWYESNDPHCYRAAVTVALMHVHLLVPMKDRSHAVGIHFPRYIDVNSLLRSGKTYCGLRFFAAMKGKANTPKEQG